MDVTTTKLALALTVALILSLPVARTPPLTLHVALTLALTCLCWEGLPRGGPDSTAPLDPDSTAPLGPHSTAPLDPHSTAPLGPDSTAPLDPDSTAPLDPDSTARLGPDSTAPSGEPRQDGMSP